jgi:hypothetical protein
VSTHIAWQQRVRDFLRLHFANEGDITLNFSLSTNYPKVEISDFSKTIQEMVSEHASSVAVSCRHCFVVSATQSLHPRGMLFVQDLDA